MQADYVIIGSGLTGAVIARLLVEAKKDVLVLERRSHLGGNVNDYLHPSGIRIHTYGPHYFRTSAERIWEFVNRFANFDRYEPCLKTFVDGQYVNWPLSPSDIVKFAGAGWEPEFKGVPENFEEAVLSMMPRTVYEKFVKSYTEKQWGISARSLSVDLATRLTVREDPRLSLEKYQGIPKGGYVSLMENVLGGIPLSLDFDYLRNRDKVKARKLLVFTGAIDEFFGFSHGRLTYRSQLRKHTYLPDASFVQPCGQVNNPSQETGPHIRTLEWKHMLDPGQAEQAQGSVLTTETPFTPGDPNDYEYPFPDQTNADLYSLYKTLAQKEKGLLICGRLGEYKYYDMDQAIARAMLLAERILTTT